jgi:hypothetical protein
MVAVPVVVEGYVVAAVLLQWKLPGADLVASDGALVGRLAGFFSDALHRHAAAEQYREGITQVEVRKALPEAERTGLGYPAALRLEKGEGALVLSKAFRICDFLELGGNLLKIAFHLLHELGTRRKFAFTNEVYLRFLLAVRRKT